MSQAPQAAGSTTYAAWLEVAVEAARAAGEVVRSRPGSPSLAYKGERNVVTEVDHAAQRLITDRLRAAFPAHGFVVEEEDATLPSGGPVQWLVDPIDGTTNFARTGHNYCICIGVAVSGECVAGLVYDPLRAELFCAVRGQGATLNGAPIAVSRTTGIEQAYVAFDWGRSDAQRRWTLTILSGLAFRAQTLRTIGSAGLALAWVAAGRLDAYFIGHLAAWDAAAGALLVQEAGGNITELDGAPFMLDHSTSILATNGRLSSVVLEMDASQSSFL
jgi:myo-inositol-1(or 4)-monophosphatase